MLASADPQAIVIWSLATGQPLHILPGHYSAKSKLAIAPTALAFSPDGRFLVSSTWSQGLFTPEKSIIVWDTTTGTEIFSLNKTGCRQVIFDAQGENIYLACDSGIQVWQLATKAQIGMINEGQPVAAIAISQDGHTIATADINTLGKHDEKTNQIKLWRLTNHKIKLVATLAGHKNDIAQLTFTAKDKRLVSSSYDGEIKVWDWQQEQEAKTLTQTSDHGLLSISPSGRLIAGNFSRGKILNVPRGKILATPIFTPLQGRSTAVTFSADGRQLAWATNDDSFPNPTIAVWQLRGQVDRHNSPEQVRRNYHPLVLQEVWQDSKSSSTPAIGSNPTAIALSALGLTEKIENETELVEVTYPQENQAIVTITQTNLADDSVTGIRYRIEFAAYGSTVEGKQWRVIWAGKQYQCQLDRGHQNWSTELCN